MRERITPRAAAPMGGHSAPRLEGAGPRLVSDIDVAGADRPRRPGAGRHFRRRQRRSSPAGGALPARLRCRLLAPDEALQEVPQMRGGLRPPLPLAEYLRWFPQLSALGRLRGAALRVERAGLRYQLERFDSRIACAEPSARCGAPARGVAHRLGYRLHRDVAALAPGLAPLPLLPRFDNDRVDHKRFGADLRERGGAIRLREALRALRTFRGSRWEAERWTWGPARALPSGAAEGRAAIRAQKMEPWRLAHVGQLGPRCAPRLIDDWPQKDLRQAAQPFCARHSR
mmetsp:Transcript_99664/g.281307  ORF Transcript_99664/g.281307 Transcript_99664/m.281307 type:complete len:286 (+) Transcript_99664:355-1212(+)